MFKTSKTFTINSCACKNISRFNNLIDNEKCKIIINNEKEIILPLFLLISISQTITDELLHDPIKREFYINFNISKLNNLNKEKNKENEENKEKFYQKLEEALHMESVEIENEDEIISFGYFGESIGNEEFISFYKEEIKNIKNNEINDENAISLIQLKLLFNFSPNEYSNEIDLISTHFENMKEKLISLAKETQYFDIVERIISNEKLVITNEDNLLEFILELCHVSNIYEKFFSYVFLEFCSIKSIKHFLSYLESTYYGIQNLSSIFTCIQRRLLQPKIPANPKQFYETRLHLNPNNFEFISDYDLLNGILQREHARGNIIMSSIPPPGLGSSGVYDLLKFDPNLDFFTQSLPPFKPFIAATIKDNKSIYITHYMIRGRKCRITYNQLQSWTLEIQRKSDEEWILIDQHENECFNQLETRIFPVTYGEPIIGIKLTQIGKDSAENDHLSINAFEIFGFISK